MLHSPAKGGESMVPTRFSRRDWLLWSLAGSTAWFLFHPQDSVPAIDAFLFALGAGVCVTLQCLILCRAVTELRAHVLWLLSAGLWVAAGAVFLWLPWSQWSEGVAEVVFFSSIAILWLITGVLQRIALSPLILGSRMWTFVPLAAALLAMVLTTQINLALLRSNLILTIGWPQFFNFLGSLFGLLYGAMTGAVAYALLARRVPAHSLTERA